MPSPSAPDQARRAYADANRDVVARVVARIGATPFLEPDAAEPVACTREAVKVRDFLNMEIPNVRGGGEVDAAFKRMRRSARDFVRGGGADGSTYTDDPAYFQACLAAMRLTLTQTLEELGAG